MGMNKQWNMKVFELHELKESENNNSEVTEEPKVEEPNPTDNLDQQNGSTQTEEPSPTDNPDQQNGSTSTEEPNPTNDPKAIDDNPSLP